MQEDEEDIGDDMRPQKRARRTTALVKCGSESSLLSSDTLCLGGGIPGGRESRGGRAEEPARVENLCESVAEAFRAGTGCRMDARPHQIECIQELLGSIRSSGSCQQEPVNYLLQHRLHFPNDLLRSCLMNE